MPGSTVSALRKAFDEGNFFDQLMTANFYVTSITALAAGCIALTSAGCKSVTDTSRNSSFASPENPRVSVVAHNGMPKNIVARGSIWNFGAGSLWWHNGWQYAAYWDDARQVSVARRQLPDGNWQVVSLPDYQRTESGDRGKGGVISRGFGDGHEKVALGISADGFIHLSFDHHLSTLRYRVTKLPVAANASAHEWRAELFGPLRDNLGGPKLESVTYPGFTADGTNLVLYLRLGGGSGAANSHFFTYADGHWLVNSEAASKVIDQKWSGGDKTVNAYPHGLVIRNGRWHLTWSWRDTPDEKTSHDLCYAYSDDAGKTWRNNVGEIIGIRGETFITADSPGVTAWPIARGSGYRNGGSMTVDDAGQVHVLTYGGRGGAIQFRRDADTGKWSRREGVPLGVLVAGADDALLLVTEQGVQQTSAREFSEITRLAKFDSAVFQDSKLVLDRARFRTEGVISVIGQQGKTVRVADWRPADDATSRSR